MAKTDTERNRSNNRATTGDSKLTQDQRRKKIAEMAAKADKSKRGRVQELLFQAKPYLFHTDSPEDRYNIWHKEIGAFKREHLKGNAYKAHRKEICLFMKKGKETGADSKMAAQTLMQEASDVCRKWVVENGGQDSMELLTIFEEMNKRWSVEVGNKITI